MIIDFLLYVCLDITSEDLINMSLYDLTAICARNAYKDLSRTVDYRYSVAFLEGNNVDNSFSQVDKDAFLDCKKNTIERVVKLISECINCYQLNNRIDFDVWHRQTTFRIMRQVNTAEYKAEFSLLGDAKEFTVGQAQKWLNMTLKYLWIIGKLPQSIHKEKLHVPIDNYVLQAIKESYSENYETKINIRKEGDNYKFLSDSIYQESSPIYLSWSRILEYDSDYMRCQKLVREICQGNNSGRAPIEWENEKWIMIAKRNGIKN